MASLSKKLQDLVKEAFKSPKGWDDKASTKYFNELQNIRTEDALLDNLRWIKKPIDAPKTFPFLGKTASLQDVEFMLRIVMQDHKALPYAGKKIIDRIINNRKLELLQSEYKQPSTPKPPVKRLTTISITRSPLIIHTSHTQYQAANNDIKKLIQCVVKFDSKTEEGSYLQTLNNAIFTRGQNILNEILGEHELLKSRKRQKILREFDRFVAAATMGRMFGQWDHGHEFVRTGRLNTVGDIGSLISKRSSNSWDDNDFQIFDPVFHLYPQGFKKWNKWAQSTKAEYTHAYQNFLIAPFDLQYVEPNIANELTSGDMRIIPRKPMKRRKISTPKRKAPPKNKKLYVEVAKQDYNDTSAGSGYDSVSDSEVGLKKMDEDEEFRARKERHWNKILNATLRRIEKAKTLEDLEDELDELNEINDPSDFFGSAYSSEWHYEKVRDYKKQVREAISKRKKDLPPQQNLATKCRRYYNAVTEWMRNELSTHTILIGDGKKIKFTNEMKELEFEGITIKPLNEEYTERQLEARVKEILEKLGAKGPWSCDEVKEDREEAVEQVMKLYDKTVKLLQMEIQVETVLRRVSENRARECLKFYENSTKIFIEQIQTNTVLFDNELHFQKPVTLAIPVVAASKTTKKVKISFDTDILPTFIELLINHSAKNCIKDIKSGLDGERALSVEEIDNVKDIKEVFDEVVKEVKEAIQSRTSELQPTENASDSSDDGYTSSASLLLSAASSPAVTPVKTPSPTDEKGIVDTILNNLGSDKRRACGKIKSKNDYEERMDILGFPPESWFDKAKLAEIIKQFKENELQEVFTGSKGLCSYDQKIIILILSGKEIDDFKEATINKLEKSTNRAKKALELAKQALESNAPLSPASVISSPASSTASSPAVTPTPQQTTQCAQKFENQLLFLDNNINLETETVTIDGREYDLNNTQDIMKLRNVCIEKCSVEIQGDKCNPIGSEEGIKQFSKLLAKKINVIHNLVQSGNMYTYQTYADINDLKKKQTWYLRTIEEEKQNDSYKNFIKTIDEIPLNSLAPVSIQKGDWQRVIKYGKNVTALYTDKEKFIFGEELNTTKPPLAYTQKGFGQSLLEWIQNTYQKREGDKITKIDTSNTPSLIDLNKIKEGVRNGLKEIHDLGFLHRDVKVDNILVDDNYAVRLMDYDRVIEKSRVAEDVTMMNGIELMERDSDLALLIPMLKDVKWLDYHQAGMALLTLGGTFNWVKDDFKTDIGNLKKDYGPNKKWGIAFGKLTRGTQIRDFWKKVISKGSTNIHKRQKHADAFVQAGRDITSEDAKAIFNLPQSFVKDVFTDFFKLGEEIFEEEHVTRIQEVNIKEQALSPIKFMSEQRQPMFEKVTIESDFDDSDLQELMDFDPTIEGEVEEDLRSHISDAEFERMLKETENYDSLSDHVAKENAAYSMEVEEDAKSVSSKHSNASDVSVASQMSNMSASSQHSNVSEMSNHSYTSNHSLESEEHYPTSEQSYHMSEQSYNMTSDHSYNSNTESSAKEMDYAQSMSESESVSESMGYSSSGGSSSNNHSYNSSSDTE